MSVSNIGLRRNVTAKHQEEILYISILLLQCSFNSQYSMLIWGGWYPNVKPFQVLLQQQTVITGIWKQIICTQLCWKVMSDILLAQTAATYCWFFCCGLITTAVDVHLYKKFYARRYVALTASVKFRIGSPKTAQNEEVCAHQKSYRK